MHKEDEEGTWEPEHYNLSFYRHRHDRGSLIACNIQYLGD